MLLRFRSRFLATDSSPPRVGKRAELKKEGELEQFLLQENKSGGLVNESTSSYPSQNQRATPTWSASSKYVITRGRALFIGRLRNLSQSSAAFTLSDGVAHSPNNCKQLPLANAECHLVPSELSPPAPKEESICDQKGCRCWISIVLNITKLILQRRIRCPRSSWERMRILLCLGSVFCTCQWCPVGG